MKLKIAVFATLFSAMIFFGTATALASPPCPLPMTVTQPSGEAITVTLHGDEWFHWNEAADGSVLVQGDDGYWRYAQYSNGELSALDARYGLDEKPGKAMDTQALLAAVKKTEPITADAAKKSVAVQRAGGIPTPTGPEKLMVILISFNDTTPTNNDCYITQTAAYWSGKMFNDYSAYPTKTDAHSSVDDYYKEVSHNKFYFQPAAETSGTENDGIISITLPYAHPAYGDDFDNDSNTVARSALEAANQYINFSAFDKNHDGTLTPDELHVVMILAGGEQAYGDKYNAVWAHSTGLSRSEAPVLDGVKVGEDYTQQGEMQADHPATIGVLAHELGHSLGLPDLYDYGDESQGLGVYSLMAAGNWEYNDATGCSPGSSPAHLDAWCNYLLGFATPVTYSVGTTLNSTATGNYNVIKVPTSDPKQYFLLENRQFSSGYDKALAFECKSGGIAIYHIDEQVLDDAMATYGGWYYINDNENHKAVDLEEANEGILGYSQLDNNYGPKYQIYNHLFHANDSTCNSVFSNTTTPSSKLYNGNPSGVFVSVSSVSSNSMSLFIGAPTITSLLANKPSPQKEDRAIRWTCAAAGSTGITYKFEVLKDGSPSGVFTGYSTTNYYDWMPAGPGTYSIRASVLADSIDTPITKTSPDFVIVQDTTNPVITAASGGSPLAEGGFSRSDVTVSLSDPDGDDVITGTYTLDGGASTPWPAGGVFSAVGTYAITAKDLVGNTAAFSFVIDKTAPVIEASASTGSLVTGQTSPGGVTVSATDLNLGSGPLTAKKDTMEYAWPAGGLFSEQGNYTVTATDKAGNAATFQFGILPNADKLTIKNSDGAFVLDNEVGSKDVTATLNDTDWSVTAVRDTIPLSSWSGSCTFQTEGNYTVTASLNSDTSVSITMHFTIDKTAPSITATNPSSAAVLSGSLNKTTVTAAVYDIPGVLISVKKDGVDFGWPIGGLFTAEGNYSVSATDVMNRKTSFTFIIDLYAPVITATRSGVKIAYNGYSPATATVSVSDVTLSSKSAKNNGAAYTWPSGSQFSSEGVYIITAKDKFGRTSTFTFTVDKTAPAITGKQSTGSGAYYGGYYRHAVTVTVSDKYLSSKSATKNGAWMAWPSKNRFTANGSYVITALDKAGNVKLFKFVVDTIKPVITVRNLSGTALRSGGTAYGGATIALYDVNLNSKSVKLGTKYITWPSSNQFTTKGTYYITVTDRAGNKSTFKFYIK